MIDIISSNELNLIVDQALVIQAFGDDEARVVEARLGYCEIITKVLVLKGEIGQTLLEPS